MQETIIMCTIPNYVEQEDPFLFPALDADFLSAGAEFSCGLGLLWQWYAEVCSCAMEHITSRIKAYVTQLITYSLKLRVEKYCISINCNNWPIWIQFMSEFINSSQLLF